MMISIWNEREEKKRRGENFDYLDKRKSSLMCSLYARCLYRITLVHCTSNNRFNRFKLPFVLLFYGFCVLRSIKYTEIWTLLNAWILNRCHGFVANSFADFRSKNMQFLKNNILFFSRLLRTDCHLRCWDCVRRRFFLPRVPSSENPFSYYTFLIWKYSTLFFRFVTNWSHFTATIVICVWV